MAVKSSQPEAVASRKRQWLRTIRRATFWLLILVLLVLIWLAISIAEWRTGRRLWPWSPYAFCGTSTPEILPQTVHIGLYEEFPNPWRLEKLKQVDFPVTLTITAPSRAEFLALREEILQTYPYVREVFFWPVLSEEEGYYPGLWSDPAGIQRIADEAKGLPVLWDMEPPRRPREPTLRDWWNNHSFLHNWLEQRQQPVHIWRPVTAMGYDPLFFRLIGLHYDPRDYPTLSLQIGLYAVGNGRPSEEISRALRCGVEHYGEHFVPALGVLNDGEGPADVFVPPETFRRYLQLARQAGVSEVWLFGANGLNNEYLSILRETLPLESLQDE